MKNCNPVIAEPGRRVRCLRTSVALLAIGTALVAINSPARAADPRAGKTFFRQQCIVCHTAEPNDAGGAQGPSLIGVYGRRSASDPAFSYTRALQDSHLTWDARTLDRFLASPTTVVPGSAMVIAVPGKSNRDDLVAYFESVGASGAHAGPPPAGSGGEVSRITGEADWKQDRPGRAHRIDPGTLPPPFNSSSARNPPKLVPRPANAQLALPPGFSIEVFARNLRGPRRMLVASNGDILLSETRGGQISVLHPAADGGASADVQLFAAGLSQPFGMAFYPDAANPKWLYVAETNRVVRYPYTTGDRTARAAPEVVVPELPSGSGHITRDIVFSADGRRMFVSVGSASNVAEDMSKKSAAEIRSWEAAHGLGAAWDREEDRAAVLAFAVDSTGPARVFASGIRNCVSLAIQPTTGDLWCTTNERDLLGDDLVPDYSTRVREGAFYGWPWYYMGSNEDPRLKGDRPDLRGKALVPDVPYQAHSAALNLTFYTATSGKSAFPAEYVGDAFAAFHGSWNRGFRTGHKLVRVRMKNGVPTGEYDDFLTGFIVNNGDAWGRPVATTVLHDGSLLMSDDGANLIYRISYGK